MKHRGGPIQQWVDSIATPTKLIDIQIHCDDHGLTPPPTPEHSKESMYSINPAMTMSAETSVPGSSAMMRTNSLSPVLHSRLVRDPSLQSDSSHCSSVESLLELRRADPEAILLGLGFGGCPKASQDNGPLSRIPKRFLQPSKLKGIAIDDFVKHQQETTESIDSASLGYRGLTGSPYVAPSEIVQKIMERLREHESHELDAYTAYNYETCNADPVQQSGLSVLSPDNREFLDRQRSKSPDISNKRMIIGKRSFTFSCDGDLIEMNNPATVKPPNYNNRIKHSPFESINHDLQTSMNNNEWNLSPLTPDSSTMEQSCRCRSFNKEETEDIERHDSAGITQTSGSKIDVINSNFQSDSLPCSSDTLRRASDSSCEVQSIYTYEEGRRFSDGTTSANPDRSKRKVQGKKILQRQARIRESDYSSHSELSDSEAVDKPNNLDVAYQGIKDVENNSNENLMRPSQSKKTFCDPKKHHLCCENKDMIQICRHDENCEECCYYKTTIKCWRKMHKIVKKNEKLESMVAKSRQEMAEIREMLNSVLSVRMEPGF